MAKQYDLEELSKAIADIERRLMGLSHVLHKNDDETLMLLSLKATLVENISELKKNSIIVMAQEYRKAREDLRKTNLRLAFLKMDRTTYETAFRNQTGLLQFLKSKYEETLEILNKKVIVVNFGKKNG